MTALTTGKIAEVLFENALDTAEHQMQMLGLTESYEPDSATMQNAGNTIWRPVQQHAPVFEGWDMTGNETGIIEETYPATLQLPKNDIVEQRADDMRDRTFWERRGQQSGKRQMSELNKSIAQLITTTGSQFFRTNAASGYDAVSEARAILDERQLPSMANRYVMLNNRDYQRYGKDLAARETLQGRPEATYATGLIGRNIAGFDVYEGSFLPNLVGGASPDTTVTGNQSFKPEAGTVDNATSTVTNVDYRRATITVAASANYNVGDKIQFVNDSTPVYALGLADKTVTNQPFTATIVSKPSATTIEIFPKPIAADDPALSALEKAYANVDTRILNGAVVQRLNIDASNQANIFWCKDSIEVLKGDAPVGLLNQFGGMKVVSTTMSNGLKMYMAYDGDIRKMTFTCRLFTWWGITNANPMANGVFVTY